MMSRRLLGFLALIACGFFPLQSQAVGLVKTGVFAVRSFGATGDGKTLDTVAINRAIDAAAESGGGVVEFSAGEYLCYTIRLKSHVTLHLGPGAVIVGAEPPPEGQPGGYDAPEPSEWAWYQDFGHTHFKNSLIWGDGLTNVAITGPGMIYGRGLSRGNTRVALPVGVQLPSPEGNPPDALEADGVYEVTPRPELKAGPFNYPNAKDRKADGVGNKAIALVRCRNVTLRDFTILHGGHFGILATGVDNLTIDNLLIDTNRDGIDVDACSNVRITNTSVNSPTDDGICLKASHALGLKKATENVTIANCFVSGFDEGSLLDGTRKRTMKKRGGTMGRIKLGTEAGGGFRNIAISNCVFEYCRGIALEQVDGGVMEDIAITNVTMRDVNNAPIFIRLGARLRAPETTEPGKVRRILISNLVAWNVAPEHGILIAGLAGHPVEDVVISNVQIFYRGGGTAEQAAREVPAYAKDYPDPWNFGTMPSWGIFARHVKNLRVSDVELRLMNADARPAVFLEEAVDARFSDVRLGETKEARGLWALRGVSGLVAREVTGLEDGNVAEVGAEKVVR
ncbi:exo-poly-alpha-D-galacturonosidase [Nibricoccus aquaticus]|uniref:Exo-poly-alpha-D-galacturonosidase n=1 Tax=Nibricoccus aquaticus TaxID=2576891 RepID=A0A290QAL0_9BACT|nr:glycoside hydrolase family 28 protein [Nibricoccus aquaticus]ATC64230.1 exo-poly-alpha-D-galacturonosidase [Nibricoccus aquaticus]